MDCTCLSDAETVSAGVMEHALKTSKEKKSKAFCGAARATVRRLPRYRALQPLLLTICEGRIGGSIVSMTMLSDDRVRPGKHIFTIPMSSLAFSTGTCGFNIHACAMAAS